MKRNSVDSEKGFCQCPRCDGGGFEPCPPDRRPYAFHAKLGLVILCQTCAGSGFVVRA